MLELQPRVIDCETIRSNMAPRHCDDHPIGPRAGLLQGHEPVGGVPSPRFSHPGKLHSFGPRASLLHDLACFGSNQS